MFTNLFADCSNLSPEVSARKSLSIAEITNSNRPLWITVNGRKRDVLPEANSNKSFRLKEELM